MPGTVVIDYSGRQAQTVPVVTLGGREVQEYREGVAGGWRRVTFSDGEVSLLTLRAVVQGLGGDYAVLESTLRRIMVL